MIMIAEDLLLIAGYVLVCICSIDNRCWCPVLVGNVNIAYVPKVQCLERLATEKPNRISKNLCYPLVVRIGHG